MTNPGEIHQVNAGLLDNLDSLLREWDSGGLLPLLPYEDGRHADGMHVREIEHVVIDPEVHDCPFGEMDGVPCGSGAHTMPCSLSYLIT